jgi:acetyl esterase/lipase
VALATLAVPANAQQRLRQLLEQRREARAAAALPAGTRIERDIAYGRHPKQRYDVYLPAKAKPGAPILLMVHGGGWRIGDKGNPGVAGDKAAYWLAKGFVFVNVNNRLLPDADPLQPARDVTAAVASVQQRAPQWGADPKRLVLMGHSAGAHLVALLGSSPDLLAGTGAVRPRGVVALDSAAMNVPGMMKKPRLPDLYHEAFGADPTFWASASPFHRLARQGLPMLVVCSSRRPDSCPQGRALAEKGKSLGVPIQVLPEDMSHAEINRDLGMPSAYTRAVSDWIDRLLN